jgi:hypothetical protein
MDIEVPLKELKPKRKRRHAQSEAQKAQQAKFLKRGYHGQKAGRPRQQGEVVARIRASADEILDILFGLLRKEHLTPGDKIRSLICEALLDRGFGRAPHTLAAAIQHTSLDGTALHLEGAAMSPLLQAAHAYAADEAKQLRPPDAMKAIGVVAEPISSQPFIADPAGNIIAAPVASAEPAAHKPEEPVAAKVEPALAAAVEPVPEKPPEPAQEAPKTKPPFSGTPADGAHSMAFKERERDREAERARKVEEARAQGRPQISREEAFPPDPREPPEVVTLGRVAGGRGIRRVN